MLNKNKTLEKGIMQSINPRNVDSVIREALRSLQDKISNQGSLDDVKDDEEVDIQYNPFSLVKRLQKSNALNKEISPYSTSTTRFSTVKRFFMLSRGLIPLHWASRQS